jgi:Flp pilus assembly protein TadB
VEPQPPHQRRAHVALTSFDVRTATAVVAVLRRAGVSASGRAAGDGEVEVTVPEGAREEAMRILGARMEEVREAVAAADADALAARARDRAGDRARRAGAPHPAPDDVHAGPPLVMERFRSLSWLAAVLLVPMLAVTIAGPLRGDLRIGAAVVLMAVVAAVVWRRRRDRRG